MENPDYKLKGGGILNWFDAGGLKADCYSIEDLVSELIKSPEAAKTVMRCVNTKGKNESDFMKQHTVEQTNYYPAQLLPPFGKEKTRL